ncbi:hypothetical protein LINPERHAP1_LOCUS14746 [Linum perenne]
MLPGANNKSTSAPHPDHPKLLDRHVRDMVNTITHRVSGISTTGSGHSTSATTTDDDELQQHGVSVITLAGTNTGATMRGEFDRDSLKQGVGRKSNNVEQDEEDEEDANVGTYVNSNFQAVNNSIMLDSNYTTNDPGVHLDISDHRGDDKLGRRGKKNIADNHEASKSSRGRRQHQLHHSDRDDASTSD